MGDPTPDMEARAGAVIQGSYRYLLWRIWDNSRSRVAFVMLNPSTADAVYDDPTIRKCIGFADRWGYGGILVANLYAWRATDPRKLRQVPDPVGIANDTAIRTAVTSSKGVVVAWGRHARKERAREVCALIREAGQVPLCIGYTKSGHPIHPLMQPYSLIACPYDEGGLGASD